MLKVVRKWVDRYFAQEEAVILLFLLVLSFGLILAIGDILAPVIASVVIAFMMQGIISGLERLGVGSAVALGLAFGTFIGGFAVLLLVVLPLAWNQLRSLLADLPRIVDTMRDSVAVLPQRYPQFIDEAQVQDLLKTASTELARIGQTLVSYSISHLPGAIGIMIYLVIIPILVFFMLKDRHQIMNWFASLLPADRPQMSRIWREMDQQLANYVRGKGIEILIVGGASVIAFMLFGMRYSLLLGFLVGLSVIIPYVGAVVVTIPVAVVAYVQWGISPEFGYLMLCYGIIQILDGNVLVPFLFSEANALHPVAIILAVLLFSSVWGVWGAFFAIPLATLVKATMNAWPQRQDHDGNPPETTVV